MEKTTVNFFGKERTIKNRNVLIYTLPIIFAGIFLFSFLSFSQSYSNKGTYYSTSDNNYWHGYVCTYVNKFDPVTNTYTKQPQDCSHNVLYYTGANATRDLLALGGGATSNFTVISLANASATTSAPTAGQTETMTTFNNCGLQNATGKYASVPTSPGNWSIYYTFTNTCSALNTSAARLLNGSAAGPGVLIAGNTFTLATLQTNDQITVNWTISVN